MQFANRIDFSDKTTVLALLSVVRHFVKKGSSDRRISVALGGIPEEQVAELKLVLQQVDRGHNQ